MKATPTRTSFDPSTLVEAIGTFAEAAAAYSVHRDELDARRRRGEITLRFVCDVDAKRVVVDAVSRDGRRASVIALRFVPKRGWMAE